MVKTYWEDRSFWYSSENKRKTLISSLWGLGIFVLHLAFRGRCAQTKDLAQLPLFSPSSLQLADFFAEARERNQTSNIRKLQAHLSSFCVFILARNLSGLKLLFPATFLSAQGRSSRKDFTAFPLLSHAAAAHLNTGDAICPEWIKFLSGLWFYRLLLQI